MTTSRWSPASSLYFSTSCRHVLDRAGRLRATQQVQVGPVAVDALEGRTQARVGPEVGVLAAGRHPRAQDLVAHLGQLHAAAARGQARQHRLLRDDAVEQVLLVVLEADVEHAGQAAHDDVARHLHGHRGLARALRAADQQHLASAEAAADGLVQRGEAQRHRLVLRDVALGHLARERAQHLRRAAWLDVAQAGVEPPRLPAESTRRYDVMALGWVGARVRLRQRGVEADRLRGRASAAPGAGRAQSAGQLGAAAGASGASGGGAGVRLKGSAPAGRPRGPRRPARSARSAARNRARGAFRNGHSGVRGRRPRGLHVTGFHGSRC